MLVNFSSFYTKSSRAIRDYRNIYTINELCDNINEYTGEIDKLNWEWNWKFECNKKRVLLVLIWIPLIRYIIDCITSKNIPLQQIIKKIQKSRMEKSKTSSNFFIFTWAKMTLLSIKNKMLSKWINYFWIYDFRWKRLMKIYKNVQNFKILM